jgi:hypothetical protein
VVWRRGADDEARGVAVWCVDLCLVAGGPGGIKEGARRSGPSDAARPPVGSTSAALPGVPPAPWALVSPPCFVVVGGLHYCVFVLFLAGGRGAVAAAGFISRQPHRGFYYELSGSLVDLGG